MGQLWTFQSVSIGPCVPPSRKDGQVIFSFRDAAFTLARLLSRTLNEVRGVRKMYVPAGVPDITWYAISGRSEFTLSSPNLRICVN